MRVLCGTSGFSYPAWKGSFYPPRLPNGRMLSSYADRLPTVEVNSTFYRMPAAKTLANWRAQVPATFRFALKAPQRVTHQKRLAGAADEVSYFYRAAAELGGTLGAVLFQLPPALGKDLPRLVSFLETLPRGGAAAFEFRHASWFSDDVFEALRASGTALCIAEADEMETPVVPTARFGYLRLRRSDYSGQDLQIWAERIAVQPWEEVYVFFKHEDQARGPALAQALSALVTSHP